MIMITTISMAVILMMVKDKDEGDCHNNNDDYY